MGWMMLAALAQPVLPDLGWFVVNDTVMGGVSSGRLLRSGEGLFRFEGELSLENNGGFVSVRTQPTDLGLESSRALLVRVRGDGRTWSLNAYRSDVPLRAGSYRAPVATVAGAVTEVVVPLADFEPTSFGRPVRGAPALDSRPGRIDRLGFLLADKDPGRFSLEVLSIEGVGERRARGPGGEVVWATLAEAIDVGVPAFNRGDAFRCRDVYRAALSRVVGSDALTDGEQRTLRAALERSRDQGADEAAWTLRHAIDTVMVGWR